MHNLAQVFDEVEQPEERVRITVYVSKRSVDELKKKCGKLSISKAVDTILKRALATNTKQRRA